LKQGSTFAISRSQQSASSRNILIHGYAAVDDRIVWGVIENHLASLRNAVEVQLAKP
jgi:uncharacterized protein YutE (UPF0331/DUF86 family)